MSTRTMFAVVLLLAVSAAFAQEKITLRYATEKGKTLLYEDIITGNTVQEMMGQEMKSNNRNRTISRIVVEDIRPDGSLVLVTSADSIVSTVKSPRMDTTIVGTEMMGKRKKLILTPLGKVLDRIVVDSVSVRGMRAMAFRESGTYHVFSPEPVAVGGKWNATIDDTVDSMGGKMMTETKMDYTLVSKETRAGHACAKITYAGTFTTHGKGSMGGMEFFVEGNGKAAGTLYWDLKGYLVAQEGTIETESTAAITGQQNMTIPSSSSMTISRNLISN